MPFIGVQPASALLTSADIQDGQITTAKVADDAITGAKIENSPTIANGLTLTDGNISLASGHGIDFGSTGNASVSGASMSSELFADYEEGIWTVSFPMTSSGSYTVRSGYATGYYRKIGNTVTVALRFETQGESSPSGNIQISGFPFAFTNADPSGGVQSYHYPILLRGYSANDANMGAFVNPQGGTSSALLYMQHSTNDTGFATITPSDVANFEGSVCFTYVTT